MHAILEILKEKTSQAARKALRGNGPVWQAETFTVALRSQEALDEKCEFVRQNPVRWAAVKTPEDYAWLWISARP